MSISLRLVPYIPWPAFNYIAGVTGMKFSSFLLGSIGCIPWVLMCAFVGSGLSSAEQANKGVTANQTSNLVILSVGLVSTVITTVMVTSYAKKALKSIQEEDEQDQKRAEYSRGSLGSTVGSRSVAEGDLSVASVDHLNSLTQKLLAASA